MKSPSDLSMETNGNCFLCSNKTMQQSQGMENEISGKAPSPLYSLHSLSCYLNLDLRKLMFGDEHIPQQLMDKVQKSKLKAELCDECAVINGNFAKVYNELEKARMEATSWIRRIHDQLEKSSLETDKAQNASNKTQEDNPMKAKKLEITASLRKETLTKCFQKINSSAPRVHIKKLTPKELDEEIQKRKSEDVTKIQASDIKMETYSTNSSDYGEGNYPLESDSTEFPPSPVAAGTGDEDGSEEFPTVTFKREENHLDDVVNGVKNSSKISSVPIARIVSVYPHMSDSTIRKKSNLNPRTDKFPCCDCPMQFSVINGFLFHYKSKHAQIRHICSICNKKFTVEQNYKKHFLSSHIGLRHKCSSCQKTFALERTLRIHQRTTHGGNRYQCKICSKLLSHQSSMSRHMKKCRLRGSRK